MPPIKMVDFTKYNEFKKYHKGFLNILFHFLGVLFQVYFIIDIFVKFEFLNILLNIFLTILSPFIFDFIGHYFGNNLKEVLGKNANNKTINIVNANPLENAIFKVLNLIDYICIK